VSGLVALPGVETLWVKDGKKPRVSDERLACLLRVFSKGNLFVDVQRHRRREQEFQNQALLDLADSQGLSCVATNGVRHATRRRRALLDVMTCIREKTTLQKAGRLLTENAERHLKPPAQMSELFCDRPDLVRNAEALGERLSFTLADLGYKFPTYPVPFGSTMFAHLCEATWAGAADRYRPLNEKARRQLERELALIGKLRLEGYFLIVWDIVNFCRRERILVQGRGSAANSAVCYSLGITAVDPVGMELLFERFLSEERGEWPDIDLDLPSGDQREKVIQYVYARYGARGAAMTANVITYRDRSASREIGKALGIPLDEIDRLAKHMRRFEWVDPRDTLEARLVRAGLDKDDARIRHFAQLFSEIQDLPRHLGQHSGGMVIAQGHLSSVVPLEPASMPGRTIVQWDKEDCADLGIVKVDLLGLGMLAAIEETLALVKQQGSEVDLAHLPQDDPKVYAMLQKADTVGLFQVESRAQMATLPRMQPDHFYDLVVEVAIIRPGPIVGKMVHPYLDRRAGREPVTYAHPSLEPILKRTLGVPLFQEQLLRMAMTVAGFTGGEAEELRRAMGFKRSEKRMRDIESRLRAGMAKNGILGETADQIVRSIASFALYGFPESHAASFALIAYASAFLRAYHTAAFTCALLNNQPMGFYHPMTLVKDAQRHGVKLLPIDVTRSDWNCSLEPVSGDRAQDAMRLGLRYVGGLRKETGERIAEERRRQAFVSLQDFVDRARLDKDERRNLAEIGALNAYGLTRRSALWQVERASRPRGALFRDDVEDDPLESPLPEMSLPERMESDLLGTGVTVGPHPMALYRDTLRAQGILSARDLEGGEDGRRVRVAGAVICRQRPGTAKGFMFLTLEDETGLVNVTVRPDLFDKRHAVLVGTNVLEIEGYLQSREGISVRAIEVRSVGAAPTPPAEVRYSRDFF
jgi:error-prone DNA polymerase